MSDEAPRPPRRRSLVRWAGVAIAVAVFVVVLPRIADYGEVWRVITALSGDDLAALVLISVVNVLTFGPPWMAAVPGLSFVRSLLLSQAATAAASVLPGGDAVGLALAYSMLRSWGFPAHAGTLAVASTTIWNAFVNVGVAVVAVAWLAASGEKANALLDTAALIGAVVLVGSIAVFALALRDARTARRVGSVAQRLVSRLLRVVRRPPVSGWDERLVAFRVQALDLLRRRWLALTAASILGHLTVFLVLLVALRVVGIDSDAVSASEAFAAWALVRLLTTVPITPGGLGIVELGLTSALVGFGGPQVRVVTAVLLYRFLTYVPPIVIGAVCALLWTRQHPGGRPAAQP